MTAAEQGSIGVIGAGAWGTALAQMLASDGSSVPLWAFESVVTDAINRTHENPMFLPGQPLAPTIVGQPDLAEMAQCNLLLVVTPAQFTRHILSELPPFDGTLLLCSKGMEAGTHQLMTEVVRQVQRTARIAVLSGPTFAHEVARWLPAAVTLAAETVEEASVLANRIARPTFRPYASDDMLGAEIGGVVKNVLAIACGVVDGAGLGQNARAALITRGFAEMARYGMTRGARMETLSGLAGFGDLVLTCSSTSSRNFSLGKGLGEGQSAAALMADRRTVAEGAFSAPVLDDDARARGIDMPIVAAVARLIAGTVDVRAVIDDLLARPLKREGWQG